MPRPSRSVRMKSFMSSAGSPKNDARALIFQHQQLPLNRADGRGRDVAVLLLQFGGVFRDDAENGAQILEIEQRQSLLVGDAKGDVEHAFLRVVELHDARQQQRPHFGNRSRGSDGLAAPNTSQNTTGNSSGW